VALDTIIRTSKDSAVIESILLPALSAKTDPREQRALIARYHVVIPERAERLTDQFKLR
jgi:hypothetical protein